MPSFLARNLFACAFAFILTAAVFTGCTGNGEKEFEKGLKLYKSEQYESAFKFFAKGTNRGSLGAQTYLGICYMLGRGVEQNEAKGIELLRDAAAQGYAEAQENLGLCYQDGIGVEKDEAAAVIWFREAAAQGNPDAHISLGLCYAQGRGVEKNDVEAFQLMKRCSELSDLPPDAAAAANFNLGLFYLRGDGVEQNEEEAHRLFRKAADLNPAMAQENFERMGEEPAP